MRLIDQPLPGVLLIEVEPHGDERGFFARSFCREEFARFGIDREIVQGNISFSKKRGTLRGLHYQTGISAETKIVTCLTGAIFDVVLDLRPGSPGEGDWFGAELSAENGRVLVVPEGCAHGFLTLRPDSLVHYLVSQAYDPVAERGVRWNDPAFAIAWPSEPTTISERDRAHPLVDTTGAHRHGTAFA